MDFKIDAPGDVCILKSMRQGMVAKKIDAPGGVRQKKSMQHTGGSALKNVGTEHLTTPVTPVTRSRNDCHGPKNCIDLGTDPQHKSQCTGRGGVH